MSETDDLARELRRLRGELATLRNEFAQVRGRQDVWAANGLDDLDAGHGNQRFAGNKARADTTGIQFVSPNASTDFNYLSWVQDTYQHTIADLITTYPSLLMHTEFGVGGNTYEQRLSYAANHYAELKKVVTSTAVEVYLVARRPATTTAQIALYNGTTDYVFLITAVPLGLASIAADPTIGLADGYLWYRSDTDKFRARINGATENLATESYVAANAASGYAATMLLMGA